MASLKDYLDKPFEGPGTQIAYQAALGRFMVAFNRVENSVRILVRQALKKHGREDFWKEIQNNELLVQIKNLQMLAFGLKGFPDMPETKIRELNARRNVLAHGHYSQDLFSEDYQIIGKTKSSFMTISEIHASAQLADEISQEIEGVQAYLWFEILNDMTDKDRP